MKNRTIIYGLFIFIFLISLSSVSAFVFQSQTIRNDQFDTISAPNVNKGVGQAFFNGTLNSSNSFTIDTISMALNIVPATSGKIEVLAGGSNTSVGTILVSNWSITSAGTYTPVNASCNFGCSYLYNYSTYYWFVYYGAGVNIGITVAGENIPYAMSYGNVGAWTYYAYDVTHVIYATLPIPPSPISNITLISPSPANNTINYYTNNNINITTNNTIPSANSTISLYYVNGTLRNSTTYTTEISSFYINGLPAGRYLFNATSTNGTKTGYTETRLFTVYNLTSGILSVVSNASDTKQFLNLTWTNTTSTNNSVANSYYLIKLLNNDTSINQTLVNTTGNNLTNFNLYDLNLSIGSYYIQLNTTDTRGESVQTSTQINITRNAILNISAYNIVTGVGINTFNVTILNLNDSTTEYHNTTTGLISFDGIYLNNYNLTYSSPSIYADTIAQKNLTARYNSINASLYPSNSLNITIYDEDSFTRIYQDFNATFTGTLSTFTRAVTNGSSFMQNITSDAYSVLISGTGYSSKTYSVTITNTTTQTLNAYMSAGSAPIGIYIVNTANTPLTATVNIYKLINSSYVAVSSTTTDVSGYTQVNLVQGTAYRITLVSSGYETRTATFTPYSTNSPYTFALTVTGSSGFVSPNSLISYIISPSFGVLNLTNYTFSFQIDSPTSIMENFNISCTGGVSDTISGSPTGGTVQIIKNVSAYTTFDCNYTYNLDGYSPVTIYGSYPVRGYTLYNSTLINGLTNFKTENNSSAWTTIIGFFIVLIVTVLFSQLSGGNPVIGTVSSLGTILLLSIVGWFDWSITIFIIAISVVWLYVVVRY